MKDKRFRPHTSQTKQKISEALTGAKLSARDYKPTPKEWEDINQMKKVIDREDGNLKFQSLLEWYKEGR